MSFRVLTRNFLHGDGPIKSRAFVFARQVTTTNSESAEAAYDLKETSNREQDDQFRVIELVRKRFARRPKKKVKEDIPKQPRFQRMPTNQDWGSVWPVARSFHPASVPLPVRMGFPKNNEASPDKWGNAELMKIPNFLHLSPPVIQRQCEVIKKFCTSWPERLDTEEEQRYHFPVTLTTASYVHASTTIRDPRARIVTLKVNVEDLELDYHSFDKLLRLVGDRYDPNTKILTFMADCCPLSSQNQDYLQYLLTVVYNESKKTEPWEHEKQHEDYELFMWTDSQSKKTLELLSSAWDGKISTEDCDQYKKAVESIHNEGEDEESLSNYKEAVERVLHLR